MMLFVWIGTKTGRRRKKLFDAESKTETASMGYLSSLLFFLLAFTFGMAGNRYDGRIKVVVQEANAIGTALLRCDLYEPEVRQLLRKDFKDYIEARIAFYEAGADIDKILGAQKLSGETSQKIWARVTSLSGDSSILHLNATRLMVPVLNEMIDLTTSRFSLEKAKVPESIIWMLFIMALVTAFYSGYNVAMKGRIDWLIEFGFCLLISLAVFFTLDLDRPRRGLITNDAPNQLIINLRDNFK